MSECDMCKGCKCPEVRVLAKKVERMEQLHKEAVMFMYRMVDKMEEQKKCQ